MAVGARFIAPTGRISEGQLDEPRHDRIECMRCAIMRMIAWSGSSAISGQESYAFDYGVG